MTKKMRNSILCRIPEFVISSPIFTSSASGKAPPGELVLRCRTMRWRPRPACRAVAVLKRGAGLVLIGVGYGQRSKVAAVGG